MPSFDIVSEVDMQEVRNAVDQAARETATRYDFKGTDTEVRLADDIIVVESETEARLGAAIDVLREKLIRRTVPLESLTGGDPVPAARGRFRAEFALQQGIDRDRSRNITKALKSSGLKVQAQVQGDQVRISGKKRDILQEAIATVKALDLDFAVQFTNFRD